MCQIRTPAVVCCLRFLNETTSMQELLCDCFVMLLLFWLLVIQQVKWGVIIFGVFVWCLVCFLLGFVAFFFGHCSFCLLFGCIVLVVHPF